MTNVFPQARQARQASLFDPQTLIATLISGLINGALIVAVSISFSSLVYAGPLGEFLPDAIALGLLSSVFLLVATSLLGGLPGTVAVIQDSPAAVLGLMTAAVVASLDASVRGNKLFLTAVAMVGLTTLLTGLFFIALGAFKLGGLIRFLPYPVVGGFLAGTGLLIMRGAFGLMTDVPLELANLGALFSADALIHWLPGIVFGTALALAARRFRHFLLFPLMLGGAFALFYLWVAISGLGLSAASQQGYLLGPFAQDSQLRFLTLEAVSHLDWQLILTQSGSVLTVVLVSSVGLLLNGSALEVSAQSDVDFNRELKVAGLGNLAAGLIGGMPGYATVALSTLNRKLGAENRMTGLVTALVCAAALLLGLNLIAYLPRSVVSGLLFFVGLSFVIEWVYDAFFKVSRGEYLVILLILAAIIIFGFLPGVGVGIIMAVVLFIVDYSQINVVKNILSGRDYHSAVERPAPARAALKKNGDSILILRLQGYIFFGTANTLLTHIRSRLIHQDGTPLRYVIVDFKQVTGVDSSAALSFSKLWQGARQRGFVLVFTDMSKRIAKQLARSGFVENADPHLQIFEDLDHGLGWCEDHLLEAEKVPSMEQGTTLADQLNEDFPEKKLVPRLVKYLVKQEFEIGDYVMKEGDKSEDIYFIESGLLTAFLQFDDGEVMRLRSFGGGTVIGEISMYLKEPRTANVLAKSAVVAYRLSTDALKRMEKDDPELSNVFHQYIVELLAERLAGMNQTLEALMG